MNCTDKQINKNARSAETDVESFMHAVNQFLAPLKLEANVFNNGQYCSVWAIDISGSQKIIFHVVVRGTCYLKVAKQVSKLVEGDAVFFRNDSKHHVSLIQINKSS